MTSAAHAGASESTSRAARRKDSHLHTYNSLDVRAGPKEGPALLQAIFRVLESRGPKESTNLLRDIMESMKLVQAITGTGAAASFVHANSYSDTHGEAFGFLTALSTVLSLMSLVVTVTIYVSLGLLEHEDMRAVEGYLVRYWVSISCTIVGSVASMLLLVAAVVVDAFHTYSRASAVGLLGTTLVGLLGTSIFAINSVSYVFTAGVDSSADRSESESRVSESKSATVCGGQPVSAVTSATLSDSLSRASTLVDDSELRPVGLLGAWRYRAHL